jgi:hypothetical protein
VGSLINDYNLFDYMNNNEKYKKEVLDYYATDPGWEHKGETPNPDKVSDDTSGDGSRVVRRFAGGPVDSDSNSAVSVSEGSGYQEMLPDSTAATNENPNNRSVYYDPYLEFSGGWRRKKKYKYDKKTKSWKLIGSEPFFE